MHSLLLVITKEKPTSYEIEELMEPYCEHNEMDPYVYRTKQEIIESKSIYIKQLESNLLLANERKNEDWSSALILRIEELKNQSDEEYYLSEIDEWTVNDDGDILATHNPNGKWDWYDTDGAGRWNEYLTERFKKAIETKPFGYQFSVRVKDIISIIEEEINVESNLEKKSLMEKEYEKYLLDIKNNPTYLEYGTGEYKPVVQMDFRTFVYYRCGFTTYSVLDEEGWHEQSVYAQDSENNEYFGNYFEKFIINNKDKYATFIDYHC